MKKNRLTVILTIVLIAIAGLLIWNNRYLTTIRGAAADFAVWDTASVTKIFLVDRFDHESLLERHEDGWTVNHDYKAHDVKVNNLLTTMFKVHVRMPVSVASHDNVIKDLAVNGVKVEVYQMVPRINLFNCIKLFVREKRTKVFYVGEATMDSSGTFMLKEGSDQPYIVNIPGFRGYLSTRYAADPDEWRDHVIFHEDLANIQSLTIQFGDDATRDFRIDNIGKHEYKLTRLADGRELPYDTLKVINLLSSFSDLRFEVLLNSITPQERIDSIRQSPFLHRIALENKQGKVATMTTHNKKIESVFDVPEAEYEDDLDRMYAFVFDDRDMVLVQYFTFDKVLKDVNYYVAGNPIQYQIEHYQIEE